ncbi:hypothetical protein C8R44DRAFT_990897 [Mycena epipterygia]|nr:hypothetical protein C8R44DRAFT_990897 [Mycena epipterygia]
MDSALLSLLQHNGVPSEVQASEIRCLLDAAENPPEVSTTPLFPNALVHCPACVGLRRKYFSAYSLCTPRTIVPAEHRALCSWAIVLDSKSLISALMSLPTTAQECSTPSASSIIFWNFTLRYCDCPSAVFFSALSFSNLDTLAMDVSEWSIDDFRAFYIRSNFPLRRLHLERLDDMRAEDLLLFLQSLPTLQTLRIINCECCDDARLWEMCTLHPTVSLRLPQLTQLSLGLNFGGRQDGASSRKWTHSCEPEAQFGDAVEAPLAAIVATGFVVHKMSPNPGLNGDLFEDGAEDPSRNQLSPSSSLRIAACRLRALATRRDIRRPLPNISTAAEVLTATDQDPGPTLAAPDFDQPGLSKFPQMFPVFELGHKDPLPPSSTHIRPPSIKFSMANGDAFSVLVASIGLLNECSD